MISKQLFQIIKSESQDHFQKSDLSLDDQLASTTSMGSKSCGKGLGDLGRNRMNACQGSDFQEQLDELMGGERDGREKRNFSMIKQEHDNQNYQNDNNQMSDIHNRVLPNKRMTIERTKQAQIDIWKALGSPEGWTPCKFQLFTSEEQPRLKESWLFDFVKQHQHNLVTRKEVTYDGHNNFEKVVQGTLYGAKFFEKDSSTDTWVMNFDKANIWEYQQIRRLEQKRKNLNNALQGSAKKGLESFEPEHFLLNDKDLDQNFLCSGQKLHNMNNQLSNEAMQPLFKQNSDHLPNSSLLDLASPVQANSISDFHPGLSTPSEKGHLLGKRYQRELIQDFEMLHEKLSAEVFPQHLPNTMEQTLLNNKIFSEQIDFLKGDADSLIQKFGSERVIGMIHAFMLLKPLIQEALEYEEKQILRLNGRILSEREANELLFKLNNVDQSLGQACFKMKESIDCISSIALNKQIHQEDQ